MHELGLTQEIIALVAERARGRRITRVVLEIGRLSAILPDAIRFCFDLCAEETPAEGATLDIIETPGLARCRACGAEFAIDRPFGQCACGECDLQFIEGTEMRVREMEVV